MTPSSVTSLTHPAAPTAATSPGTSPSQNTSHPIDHAPLIALLGHAHDALESAFDERLRASEFTDLTIALSRNVLRHLSVDECRASQLAHAAGVSKQALSLQIDKLERSGYVRTEVDEVDRRAKRVVLTAKGARAQELVRHVMAEIDAEWHARWGDELWTMLRGHLVEVISSRDQVAVCGDDSADDASSC